MVSAAASGPGSAQTVVALAVHPATVAATRLRVSAYHAHCADKGIRLRLWSLFQPDDLRVWYGPSHRARAGVLLRALPRLRQARSLIRAADTVIVQREALPFASAVLERYAVRRGVRLVWDVDDAVWQRFESPTSGRVGRLARGRGGKYRWLRRHATEIWAGSAVLAQWCAQGGRPVTVVPTVVAVPDERPARPRTRVAGWIGSHSTGPFLETVLPAIAAVRPRCALTVVGAAVRGPEGLEMDACPWSPAAEERALGAMRVGLYPVDVDHPLAEGKCGLKAILYMSRGIPPVVTPTTPNAHIVRHGREGLHARTHAEWTAAVQTLLDDPELWERLSQAAYARVRDQYSLQVWGERIADRLVRLGGMAP